MSEFGSKNNAQGYRMPANRPCKFRSLMALDTIRRVGADGDCEMRRAWYLASELAPSQSMTVVLKLVGRR